MTLAPPLEARGLRKRYGDTHALDGFDLTVAAGSVHALLGPNGAGKSTAVHTLATLTRIDEGEARVAGFDVATQHAQVRAAIGLVGQSAALDEILHGRENLVMFARLHGLGTFAARTRADELLEALDLADAADRKVSTYSGGMRRRLDIAAGLITRPAVLFLDEPTTGLDPRGRADVWDAVRRVVALGTTVLLTTQYLDEADRLADRITVMDAGRVIAEGTPAELKSRLGGDRVLVVLPTATGSAAAKVAVAAAVSGEVRLDEERAEIVVEAGAEGGTAALLAVVRALDAAGITPTQVQLREPTLDEVFLHLTDRPTTTDRTATADGGHR
ncbi:ATP-binding cassette domain-containing protein [Nocardioides glacieisoli]|uniref:ATP-binding cassette domain-containing protein n=1 Tax=Nocardioides glacieisoli TaxID=1168730 RepID=A0A4Q2RV47_9ACTN|nr:ATP-binding cassette domain-containing protein [Nocardioides glacieisoli]RYB92748.1 ATP-binding cassette domain-containing protein [Nocardioides glacieisoli]